MLPPHLLLTFLVYFFGSYQAVQSRVTSRINPELPSSAFCSKKCEENGTRSHDEDFPLYQCSCSRSCSTFGDCCFDSPFKNTTLQQNIDFICISVVGYGRFKAVSSCPPNQSSGFCKDGLGHLPPVTSKVTNITYVNMFCAICNGDGENVVTWNVKLRCSSDLSGQSNDTSNVPTRYVYRSDEIWSLNEADDSRDLCMYHMHFNDSSFMKGLEFRKCTEVKRVSECSASWKDLPVLNMCRSYEDPVYFHDTVYRNAHCAFCNYLNLEFLDCIPFHVKIMVKMGLIDFSVRHFCKDRGSDECIQSLSGSQKGKSYSFSEILNISEKECVPPKRRRCCRGQSFDSRTGKCRRMYRQG